VSQYTVYITPVAWREIRDLPGHMRQRVRRALTELADNPRPSETPSLGPRLYAHPRFRKRGRKPQELQPWESTPFPRFSGFRSREWLEHMLRFRRQYVILNVCEKPSNTASISRTASDAS
jgi:hypothetical protein